MIVDDQQVMMHKVGILIATDTNIVIELTPKALADTSGNFITSIICSKN